ncbi:MAG TPA: hypothetical protein VK426_00385, partial [Methanobacterium sp.]|nr:hypothetical protein [Methanobacterium sp.]
STSERAHSYQPFFAKRIDQKILTKKLSKSPILTQQKQVFVCCVFSLRKVKKFQIQLKETIFK